MTSSGRYTYAREIISKKATKVISIIKRFLSNIDSSTIVKQNKLFDALVKPILLYGCEIWGPELLSYKTHFDKSTIEQVHIRFCKQALNKILEHRITNPILNDAFLYAKKHTKSASLLNDDEALGIHSDNDISAQQLSTNSCCKIKHRLRKNYFLNWSKVRNCASDSSREKFTHKEVKKDYQLEEYLTTVKNPAHRISITKLRLGVHSLRIQTGKYENAGASIPVEERKCLVCKENRIEDEQHFLMYCKRYNDVRKELHSIVSQTDPRFVDLTDHEKYLLKLDNYATSRIIAKYIFLMFQKRKEILN
ncbi:uncharacterized protein LOC144632140 [Oculina patagonica]